MHRTPSIARLLFAMTMLGTPAGALAQDSVAVTPGNSDALSPYTNHTTRYIVDLQSLTSSWGNSFFVGPVLKASADNDPMFPTQILGAVAFSPDQIEDVTFASTDFAEWSSPGAGVNIDENSPPMLTPVSGYDRQFAIGMSDLSASATNTIGALVGQDADNVSRLYVTRVTTLVSRGSAGEDDTATLAIGGIDADGNLYIRADDFNAANPLAITGENILRVNAPMRNASVNFPLNTGSGNFAIDLSSTSFLINDEAITTNVPAAVPESLAGSPLGVVLDFASAYRPDGGPGVMLHLDSAVDAHRGNPSFSATSGAGIGAVASLAKATGSDFVDSINIFEIDSSGTPVSTTSATLPSPISDGAFSTNVAGDAQFLHYLSQTSFRGANGQAAVVHDGSAFIAAATATDPTDGDFVAVADFSGGTPSWTIAAHVGKDVLDGPGGSPIGTIATASPATISSPALDVFGNVYFVASFDPTVGSPTTALIKGVNNPGGYELELILKAGDSFVGPNSSRTYTIEELLLADSDSIASGSFFSGSVLQPQIQGLATPTPADPWTFGGALVNAKITYNNAGTPEPYQAALYVGPSTTPAPIGCDGDADGNGDVNVSDISFVIFRLGDSGSPCLEGDTDGDGQVNVQDITYTIFRLGTCNPVGPCL